MRYMICPSCRKRMRRSAEFDARMFYYCPCCGERRTYHWRENAISDGWPDKIFDQAVREGVLSRRGQVLAWAESEQGRPAQVVSRSRARLFTPARIPFADELELSKR
jgi:hypothetical protein